VLNVLKSAVFRAFPPSIKRRDVEKLAIISSDDLSAIFRSPKIEREWNNCASRLSEICKIEDGKTGGVNPGDRRAIFFLISGFKPSSILEIGTHVGASTIHFAAAMAPSATLKTVDIEDVNAPNSYWRSYGLDKSPRDMTQALGRNVQFVKSNSIDFLNNTKERFDFIFLDGNHSKLTVLNEVPRALHVLNQSGTILLHDYFPDLKPLWSDGSVIAGPFEAMRKMSAVRVLPLGALPWPTKLQSNVTSLAICSRAAGHA